MRKKLALFLLLTCIATSAFADGVIGSGTRSEEDNPPIGSGADDSEQRGVIGSGTRSGVIGSGGLRQRIAFTFMQLLQLAEQRASGYFGSGN